MTKINQKEAVFNAVTKVLSEHKEKFESMKTVVSNVFAAHKEYKQEVIAILVTGFTSGMIELDKPQDNMKAYCSGLLNNWLRKDPRLSGGTKYVPQNKGSRAGQGDESIREMRKLLSATTSDADKALIQKTIDARIGEIKAARAKEKNKVDPTKIPDALKHLVG